MTVNSQLAAFGIFHIIAIFSAIIINLSIKNNYIAALVAALITTIIYQIAGYCVVGYLDPLVLFAVVISFLYALIISGAVTAVFHFLNKKKKRKRCQA
ncbi:MAG: hypothetical protein ACLFV2_10520 [Desulfurivibrionaceae bacterium]